MTRHYINELGCPCDTATDLLFEEAAAMRTTDEFGRTCHFKTALYYKALASAWGFREITYKDGRSMQVECNHIAAKHFRAYADQLDGITSEQ